MARHPPDMREGVDHDRELGVGNHDSRIGADVHEETSA